MEESEGVLEMDPVMTPDKKCKIEFSQKDAVAVGTWHHQVLVELRVNDARNHWEDEDDEDEDMKKMLRCSPSGQTPFLTL